MQGKATEDVRDIRHGLIQNNLFVENWIKDTAKHSIDSTIINKEHISTLNNTLINDQNDPQTVKNEIDKH